MMWVYMSHPSVVDPKMCPSDGPFLALVSTHFSGSVLVHRPGNAAIDTTTTTIRMLSQKTGLLRSCCHASLHRLPPGLLSGSPDGALATSTVETLSLIADPRVEYGVQQVDEQRRDQEDERQERRHRDDDRGLPTTHRLVGEA